MITALAFLIIISVLILVHEGGHFLAARRAGILVEEFGFGLPPRIWGKKIGKTICSINALPFGGFVRLYGEEKVVGRNKEMAFSNKSQKVRIKILLSGVLMNLLLGTLVFCLVYSFLGIPEKVDRVRVEAVLENSPSQEAGLRGGDIIDKFDGREVRDNKIFVSLTNQSLGKPVVLDIIRESEDFCREEKEELPTIHQVKAGENLWLIAENYYHSGYNWLDIAKENHLFQPDFIVVDQALIIPDVIVRLFIKEDSQEKEGKILEGNYDKGNYSYCEKGKLLAVVIPRVNPPQDEGSLGVVISDTKVKFYPIYQMVPKAIYSGFLEAFYWIKEISISLVKLTASVLTGRGMIGMDVAGPVGIYQITGEVVKAGGWALIQLAGILSVNLAVLNIIPFPALDGGRIAFVLSEKFLGKRGRERIEIWANRVGMAILLALILLVTINDIKRMKG